MLKKALIYLGLGPDEEYEQYADSGESLEAVRPIRDAPVARPSGTVHAVAPTTPGHRPPVRPLGSPPRPEAVSPAPTPTNRQAGSAIRIVESAVVKPHASSPTSFNEAQDIGDRFKSGQPVIVNLQGVESGSTPSDDRFLERAVLRPRGQDGQGRHPRLHAHSRRCRSVGCRRS